MEAGDKQAVAAQLRSKGLIVVDIEEQVPASAGDILARFQRVKADELVIATRQLSTMVNSGMSLLRVALRDRGADRERQAARDLGSRSARTSRPGLALSDALAQAPGHLQRPLRRDGRRPARPEESWTARCVRVADQLEKDAALRRQIKAAMIYPALIGGFALVVLFALVAFLVPVFEKIFKDFGGELPAITKFTVLLSHLVTRALVRAVRRCRRRSSGCSASGRTPSAAGCSGTA